ncbi:Putative steroid dehydrogenase 2 [Caenorhabditis elegans]|uniref:Putative steroid dehydrogenase 2 n=1 Tax=Caenorhabditis elegans TaxID=6239 RepID=STDH2_CAEEL|nr:Putative steroid dehydrogenase 2 [Caenorhabditis elegans]O17795.1 RecName: Full=Putative steroid dehydrogenase 2 [Caenorhabditis elegans]CAB07363.1 Putative steroid dehydrogenase 2 [Caenorhabditis elegans]|eukprot:NP_507092.1 Putative steroid dehydrogenase 2 [Caenorhabditis elegans]
MDIQWFATGVGAAVVLYIFYHFIRIILNILVPYAFCQPIDLKKKAGASWAVVTGATDGIGKSYSFELARRGFNVYIVSRTQSKLEQTKKDILEKQPDIEVRFATYDFTNPSVTDYEKLLSKLNEVSVGILINNVGMFFDYPEMLHKINGGIDSIANVIIINTLPATLLSAGILPQMVSRKAGIIVNIGSFAGVVKLAEWSIYSATKKYVEWLTGCLRKEYSHHGIIFQAITPAMVATKMAGNPNTSFFCPDSDTFARSALNTIGHASETTGYIAHQIQCEILKLLPDFVIDRSIKKGNAEFREKALAKSENKPLA